MDLKQIIIKLKDGIQHLPGHNAHRLAAPGIRLSTAEYLKRNPSYKSGCVMIILTEEGGSVRILLIERSVSGRNHAGQIGFPGGRREEDDKTLLDTANRETYEEIGIDPSVLAVIGQLSDIYIPVSNYLVHPFVSYAEKLPGLQLMEQEVKAVLLPPLDLFLRNEMPSGEFLSGHYGIITAPYYSFETHKIWGATAMIIRELVEIIKR